ncbi:hypothetical protein M406DRAFT_253713 [Cryphonectria parasitica EP155]|uniref:Uncharacterized protein n=1 Tax=Cryphonectria parasitica (strain ATCC 38755 / EP155) TaxID=660469 RepID=A0A9P4Y6W2_CRYP1|nr:uncharacterized protein M406DRAFT_253713 [Cryphonectria parasitica EP155]KAF3768022.1 hypothetical protein M406DRAFT_253713 [Cryphonectria parasitica EP155]
MDPDCAICHAPATMACDCEAKGLETAIRQAEARMMQNIYNEIRSWVRAHAQDYILEYFRLLTDRRKEAHTAHIDRITHHAATYYHAPPHPEELNAAQQALKLGIDEDWQTSVQRYPEVLQYFYSLVEFTLPADDEPGVRDPPLSALGGSRQPMPKRRLGGDGVPTIASGHMERGLPGRRTPPSFAPSRADRRTPGPMEPERRRSYGRVPPANPYYSHLGPYY